MALEGEHASEDADGQTEDVRILAFYVLRSTFLNAVSLAEEPFSASMRRMAEVVRVAV
jgi:hypothetical protein